MQLLSSRAQIPNRSRAYPLFDHADVSTAAGTTLWSLCYGSLSVQPGGETIPFTGKILCLFVSPLPCLFQDLWAHKRAISTRPVSSRPGEVELSLLQGATVAEKVRSGVGKV